MTDLNQTVLETVNEEDEETDDDDEGGLLGRVEGRRQESGRDFRSRDINRLEAAAAESQFSRMADSVDSGVESDNGKLSKSIEDQISGECSSSADLKTAHASKETGSAPPPRSERGRMTQPQDGGERIMSRRELNEIYTQWANHYLEKAEEDRRINDLQVDLADGLLLAAIVQVIANEKLKDLDQNPTTADVKISNIQKSLDLLRRVGLKLENITAKDVHCGQLQSILILFYSLSRLKQRARRPSLDNKRSCQSYSSPRPPLDQTLVSRMTGNHLYIHGRHLQAPVSNNNDDVIDTREPDESWSHVTHPSAEHLTPKGAASSSDLRQRQHLQQLQQQSLWHYPHLHLQQQQPDSVAGDRRALKPPGGVSSRNLSVSETSSAPPQGSPRSSIPTPVGQSSASTGTEAKQQQRGLGQGQGPGPPGAQRRRSVDEKAAEGAVVDVEKRPAACMLGKLKLFNSSKDAGKAKNSSPCTSVVDDPGHGAPPPLPPSTLTHIPARIPERRGPLPEVPVGSRDDLSTADRTVARGQQQHDKRATPKGRPKDASGSGSGLPVGSASLIPTMDDSDRKRSGTSGSASAAAPSRIATSGSHPRPTALPSSRASSSSSICSLPGAGTLGTPVAGGGVKSSGTKSSTKGGAGGGGTGGYSSSGAKGAQRQGTATAIPPPPTSVSAPKAGKSGVPSGRSRQAKSPSTVGANQPVGKSPSSSAGLNQPLGKSPSSLTINQPPGVPPSGGGAKMAAAKQLSGPRRPSESDDLNKSRSTGTSGSRTVLNATPSGGASGHVTGGAASRGGLPVPQAGRREGSSAQQPDQRRQAQQVQGYQEDHRRRVKPDEQSGRQGQGQGHGPSNVRSPVNVPQSAGSSGKRSVAVSGPGLEYGFSSVSSFKPGSSSPSGADPRMGVGVPAREAAPQEKPRKIDSDTQTTASVMQASHLRRQAGLAGPHQQQQQLQQQQLQQQQQQQLQQQQQQIQYQRSLQAMTCAQTSGSKSRSADRKLGPESKDQSSSSLNSDSTNASGVGDESSKSGSASNSNNSASSTDSVIYRPSSCDEAEQQGGADGSARAEASRKESAKQNGGGGKSKPPSQFTDHISSLRNKRSEENQRMMTTQNGGGGKRGDGSPVEQNGKSPDRDRDRDRSGSAKDGNNGAGEEMLAFDVGIKPMQPIIRSSPYAYLRSLPVSLGRPPPSSSGAPSSSRLGAHRPLLDPSNMYLHPGRTGIGGGGLGSSGRLLHRAPADVQSDTEGFDVTAGYMSDGEILRSSYLDDVNCGYMSEGGLTQYVKRIQQRFREGMLAVRECMEKSNVLVDDDSADDGSSISSSEISDAINDVSTDENLTGSSLSGASSDQNSYGSIRHGFLGPGVAPYPCRSLPLSHRAYHLQQMRAGGCMVGQNRPGNQPDSAALGENWQKYTIRDESRGGGVGAFSRGTVDRATLPVTARDRVDPRGFGGYPLGIPGGIYVKKSHQAVITDLKGRSLRGATGSGTAVAVEDGNAAADQRSASSQQHLLPQQQQPTQTAPSGGKQKRDSETNTDLSAMMVQKTRGGSGGAGSTGYYMRDHGLHQAGSVSDCESSRSTRSRGQGLAVGLGAGGLFQGDAIRYPYGTNSLERQAAAMASSTSSASGRRTCPDGYNSGSLGRKHLENPADAMRTSDSSREKVLPRGGYETYVNVDSLWTDHGGPCSRPLSDGLGSPPGMLGGNGGRQLMMKPGRVLRTALSETDSVEDLSYSPYGLRGHGSQSDAYGPGSRSLKHGDELNRGQFYSDYPPSASPGNTLHRAESLHMTSASGAHGSSLSLMSSSSSVYSTAEEKQAQEIRKLRRELEAAQEKVNTLTTQLSTNAHVVAAFEQSLASMTSRLQQLTSTSHQKDSELNELRKTIDGLRVQSKAQTMMSGAGGAGGGGAGGSLPRQATDQTKDLSCAGGLEAAAAAGAMNRHMSADSVASLNSLSSACSRASQQSNAADLDKKKKKKNWLKSSFTKAFSRKKGKPGSASDFDADSVSLKSDTSMHNTSMMQTCHPMSTPTTPTRAVQMSALMMKSDCVAGASSSSRDEAVSQLKHELHEKDLKLTDIQLEALASAHQLEQLCDTMNRMKSEMSSLKADNERLQRIIVQRGLDPCLVIGGRNNNPGHEMSPEASSNRLSLGELSTSEPNSSPVESLTRKKEGRRVLVSILLGSATDIGSLESKPAEVLIGALLVSKATKWESFESAIRKAFKEYMTRVEPSNSMGLNSDSILMYRVGDVIRTKSSKCSDHSPFDCLKDQPETVSVTLKGTQENCVDSMVFETLVPKPIMQRYVSLLLEHRRIILCGPSGTGKTYLAQKLAQYVVSVSGKDLLAGHVATFNVDHKSSKELRQYLANIAEQCEHNAADLPSIIILDNLHHVGSLGEVFTGFLSVKHQQCPYIIGTMNQTTCSTTNLQLHHNFRWVLCANHMEPVKGFLGRYLRHKLVEEEVKTGIRNQEMNKIADWLPRVWQHLNKFLELHSSSDVTIGPRLFLACPMDVSNAQVWFTDLWNYSIVPYLLEAVREGIQTYGHRAPWEDPAEWVIETYPWDKVDMPTLLHLRTEDVGYDPQSGGPAPGKPQSTSSDTENKDPLMNMLLRLQEAASYSSPASNESDSTSLDSHESRLCGSASKSPVQGDAKT